MIVIGTVGRFGIEKHTVAIKDNYFKIFHTNLLFTFFFFFRLLPELTINADVKFRLNLAVGFQRNDIEITPFLHSFIFNGQCIFLTVFTFFGRQLIGNVFAVPDANLYDFERVFRRGDDGYLSFYLLSGDAAQSNLAGLNRNKFFNLSDNG